MCFPAIIQHNLLPATVLTLYTRETAVQAFAALPLNLVRRYWLLILVKQLLVSHCRLYAIYRPDFELFGFSAAKYLSRE